MTTKQTLTMAVIAAGLMAAPAFAQDKMTDTAKDEVASEAKSEAETVMKDKMDEFTLKEGVEADREAPEKIMTRTDGEMKVKGEITEMAAPEPILIDDAPTEKVMTEKAVETDKMMDTPVIEAPITTVEIPCPEGTTAQADGTCLVTGDFEE